jgi:hypothetical protein
MEHENQIDDIEGNKTLLYAYAFASSSRTIKMLEATYLGAKENAE